LAGTLEAMAAARGCTVAQLCLAWLLAQGEDVLPIPGTRSLARMEENLGALDIALSAEELARIDEAVPPGAAAGSRYPAGQMKAVFI
jgi:aryl-alcohol dehydrogenase-like predicted oxidoreductase